MDSRFANSVTQFRQLAAAFQKQQFKPLYLLYGEERYFLSTLMRLAVQHAVEEDFRDFNYSLLYGDEISAADAISVCKTASMMSERRLVIIRRFDSMKDKGQWADYAKRPNPQSVVLLICLQRPDFRTKVFKTLKSHAVTAEFKPLKGRQISSFIRDQVKHTGGTIDPEAVSCLQDYVGSDAASLVNEIEKLQLFTEGQARLTKDDVIHAIGQSRDANVWELENAVREKRLADAERIAGRLMERSSNTRGEAVGIVAILGSAFTNAWLAHGLVRKKLSPRQLEKAMKVHSFVAKKSAETARRFGAAGLYRAFRILLAADCELKGGSPRDPRIILTLMLKDLISTPPPAVSGTRRRRN